jgi:hypothetical protein
MKSRFSALQKRDVRPQRPPEPVARLDMSVVFPSSRQQAPAKGEVGAAKAI